jgi:hypothetical protein
MMQARAHGGSQGSRTISLEWMMRRAPRDATHESVAGCRRHARTAVGVRSIEHEPPVAQVVKESRQACPIRARVADRFRTTSRRLAHPHTLARITTQLAECFR